MVVSYRLGQGVVGCCFWLLKHPRSRGVVVFFLGAIYLELAVSEFVSKEVWFVT